ncbi:hypothetical protein BDR07DRAFT_1282286 [Suillus spraguei]|nr:hypothetical protein BDR07DRAFT_1282286 [Suillus spraguei]
MKSISLASMIVAVAVMAGVATAYDPIGQTCDTPGGYECANDANINGGNAFIYECDSTGEFVYVAGCACPSCCVSEASGAYCT